MKATNTIIGSLIVGCVLACCFSLHARIYDSSLIQQGAGTFFNSGQNQTYAVYQILGFQPSGFYFVTSKTNIVPGVSPVWNTYTLEGYLQAPANPNSSCKYGIPLDNSNTKFFRTASFDGTAQGLYAPSSAILVPTNGQVLNGTTNQFFEVKTEADDAQAVCQIVMILDGQRMPGR